MDKFLLIFRHKEGLKIAKGSPVLKGDGNSVEVLKIAKGHGTH